MKHLKRLFLSYQNVWIAIGLVGANVLTCTSVLLALPVAHVVDPIRDPEIVTLLNYIRSGDRSGESWEVTLTELEAEQTITWYLQRYPQIPFEHPQIEITSDFVTGKGDATIAGLRVHVGGKARVTLKDGLPRVEILELSLPLPNPIQEAIEDEIQRQLQRADLLPVRFTEAEWHEGEVVVRGIIR